ncbi:MAG TPA: precorrin-6y C5,15-methyltransferase (decarboxylating) subunit CbiE [Mycobacteriales bacterium]|nr:precorrin-6y C5,15-methyltransferase (decarboxylating) subunit CbiE [Mycobacteriales bacterium]
MITVVGLDGSPLSPDAQARLAAASLVMGGRRHLREALLPDGVPTVALRDDPEEAVRAVVEADGDVVVLASGDPGFFGVVRLLRERVPAPELEVLPGVSSVALAFARLGLPWDDAVVVSAHGRSLRPAVAACRAHPKVAVLTSPGAGPAELAAALGELDRRVVVAERMGLDGERLTALSPAEAAARDDWDPLNVVVVLDEARAVAADKGWLAGRGAPSGWGLPESAFEHRDGMVTKAEVRAHVLARLGPRLGDLVWDVGAGSGSVAVECARLGAAVVAVERGDVTHLRANAKAFGVDLEIVQGEAPAVLAPLPDPDAVFVGGGGVDVVSAVVARCPQRVVVALATLERVGPVLEALDGYDTEAVLLQAQRVEVLGDGHRLLPTNPVFVVSGARR